MNKLQIFLESIDWVLCAVLVIGGRYWGRKYFRPFKNHRFNFLAFATLAGIVYVITGLIDGIPVPGRATNLLVTYLFATSFYELLAKLLFNWLENKFPVLDELANKDGDLDPGPGSNPGGNPPPPPRP